MNKPKDNSILALENIRIQKLIELELEEKLKKREIREDEDSTCNRMPPGAI